MGDKLDNVIKCRGILGCLPNIQGGRLQRQDGDSIQWRYKKKTGSVTITFQVPLKLRSKNGSPGTTITLDQTNNWTSDEYLVDPDVLLIGPITYDYKTSCSDCLFIGKGGRGGDPQLIIEP